MRRLLLSTTALILLSAPVLADPPAGRGEGHGHADQAAPQRGGPGGADRGGGERGPAPQAMQAAPPRNFDRGGDHGPGRQAVIQQQPNREQMREQNRGDQNRGDWRGRPQASIQPPPDRGDRGPRPQASMQAPQPSPSFDRTDRNRDDRRAFNDNRGNDNLGTRPGFNRDFNRDGRTDYRGQRSGPRHDFSGFRDFHRNFQASRRFRGPDYRRPAGWYSHRWAFGEFLPAAFWVRDYWLIDFAEYDLPPPPYGAVWVRVDHDALLIDEDSGEIITVAYDVFY
jgi:Ni/Co efflux regulator RcnB